MKKIICLIICLIITLFLILSLTACTKNTHDHIEIRYKSETIFDDIGIDLIDGYFYQSHEKFRVDENTIAVTIYFSNKDDEWEYKGGVK